MTDELQCMPDEFGLCVHCRNLVIGGQTCSVKFKRRHAPPTSIDNQPKPRPMLLGDYTEWMLSQIGVTEEWYKEAKQTLGLAPTCWCPERKEWLNRANLWLKNKLGGG